MIITLNSTIPAFLKAHLARACKLQNSAQKIVWYLAFIKVTLEESWLIKHLEKAFGDSLSWLLAGASPGPEVLLQLLWDYPRLAPGGELGLAGGQGVQGRQVRGQLAGGTVGFSWRRSIKCYLAASRTPAHGIFHFLIYSFCYFGKKWPRLLDTATVWLLLHQDCSRSLVLIVLKIAFKIICKIVLKIALKIVLIAVLIVCCVLIVLRYWNVIAGVWANVRVGVGRGGARLQQWSPHYSQVLLPRQAS